MGLQTGGVEFGKKAEAASVNTNDRRPLVEQLSQRAHDAAIATNDHCAIDCKVRGQCVVDIEFANHRGVPRDGRAHLRNDCTSAGACQKGTDSSPASPTRTNMPCTKRGSASTASSWGDGLPSAPVSEIRRCSFSNKPPSTQSANAITVIEAIA